MEVVQQLIEKGADVNTENNNWETPLLLAASAGHTGVVQLLVENGAAIEIVEVRITDGIKRTPLSWAAQNGHAEVIKMLLKNGVLE